MISPPFNGAWDMPQWDTDFPAPNKRGRKMLETGRGAQYQIAIRLEPAGDLVAFGDALAKALRWKIDLSVDLSKKKSIAVVYNCIHRSPQKALASCTFRIDRALRKAGQRVDRISYDVTELS